MPCIYKIQNKKTGKVYIGQTKRSLEWRLNNAWCGHFHKAESGCTGYLSCAIRKYGKDSFTYEVLEEKSWDEFETKKDLVDWLNTRETYWISYYQSNKHDFGYNKTKGGQTGKPDIDYSASSKRMTEYNNKFWSNEENRKQRSALVSIQSSNSWKNPSFRNKVIAGMALANSQKTPEEKRASAKKGLETRRKNGTLGHTDATKELIRQKSLGNTNVKGRIYVHKPGQSKLIEKEDFDKFISEGWMPGRGKVKWSKA